jgi:hypothetical protein
MGATRMKRPSSGPALLYITFPSGLAAVTLHPMHLEHHPEFTRTDLQLGWQRTFG